MIATLVPCESAVGPPRRRAESRGRLHCDAIKNYTYTSPHIHVQKCRRHQISNQFCIWNRNSFCNVKSIKRTRRRTLRSKLNSAVLVSRFHECYRFQIRPLTLITSVILYNITHLNSLHEQNTRNHILPPKALC